MDVPCWSHVPLAFSSSSTRRLVRQTTHSVAGATFFGGPPSGPASSGTGGCCRRWPTGLCLRSGSDAGASRLAPGLDCTPLCWSWPLSALSCRACKPGLQSWSNSWCSAFASAKGQRGLLAVDPLLHSIGCSCLVRLLKSVLMCVINTKPGHVTYATQQFCLMRHAMHDASL